MHFKEITALLAALTMGVALANPIPDPGFDLISREEEVSQANQAQQGDQAHQAGQGQQIDQARQEGQDKEDKQYQCTRDWCPNPRPYCNPNDPYGGCYNPYRPQPRPNPYCNPNDPYGGCYRPYNPYPPQPRPNPSPTGRDIYGQPCGIGQICSNCNGVGGICYSGPQPGCSCY